MPPPWQHDNQHTANHHIDTVMKEAAEDRENNFFRLFMRVCMCVRVMCMHSLQSFVLIQNFKHKFTAWYSAIKKEKWKKQMRET